MLSVSDPALADLVRRLRLGHLGAEHSPAALADVLERLLRERTALAAQLRTLEQIAATPATAAAARNAYGRGFAAAVNEAAELAASFDFNLELAIQSLQPQFAAAGAAARAN